MDDGSTGRKSRRKRDAGQPRNRKNEDKPKIAAHKSNWSLIGKVRVEKENKWISNWSCTHCGRTRYNESSSQNAKPATENHEATY